MGAKQRAQQRGKKAAKGSMKGQPMSQRQISQMMTVPDLSSTSRSKALLNWNKFSQSSFAGAQHGFSMSEEAMNTDRRAFGWGAAPLRTQGITFISAGHLKRDEDGWNTVSEEETPQKQSDAEKESNAQPTEPHGEAAPLSTEPHDVSHTPPVDQSKLQNMDGGPTVTELQAHPPTIESSHVNGEESHDAQVTIDPSSSPMSDSEEEIIFAGRAAGSQRPSRKPTPAPPPQSSLQHLPTSMPDPIATGDARAPGIIKSEITTEITSTSIPTTTPDLESTAEPSASTRPQRNQQKGPVFSRKLFSHKYDEEDLMQDYIDNMALDDTEDEKDPNEVNGSGSSRKPFKKTETFRMFRGDGLENAKVQTRINGSKRPAKMLPDIAFDWNSDDLADFDDISTTDEEVDDIGQVIRHRTRPSGPQYLVIANGSEASDAKWMLHSKLVSQSAVEEIHIYEEIRQLHVEEEIDDDDDDDDEDSEEDDDEDALQDLIDNIESEDDENARIMNYTARMTDEQIARALAKQEELGLGSDELLLFDGDVGKDVEAVEAFGDDDFVPFDLGKHTSNRGRSKRNKKQRDSFPSAEAFADALDQDPYGAFDVMDFERPSLRPTKKGRKSDFPWDLGDLDEDLRDQLVNTWTKDREKKAERKRQREEDRLNASLDAADSSDPALIKQRIRQFLIQNVDELRLSPMESAVRAAVHRLAKALKLNSRSEGKEGIGIGRYPVLTKTPRTPHYTVETIWEIDALMNTRKFFPKSLIGSTRKTPRTPGSVRRHGGGGGSGVMSGATYRDGEVVGASAPEISADNRGRAMLEKMGWTVGMGIGAEGNKGSLDHVRHIVKTSKAGLG